MDEIVCPSCIGVSENRAKYCQTCGQPLRCRDCGSLLSREARICSECGAAIPERSTPTRQLLVRDLVPPGYNRLKIDQTLDEYHLDYVFSNQVAAEHEGLIANLVSTRRHLHSSETNSPAPTDDQLAQQVVGAVTRPQLPAADPQPSLSHPSPSNDSHAAMWNTFGKSGDKIEQIGLDLKADTQQEYVTRLVRLFLRAHQLIGHPSVAVNEIHEMLKRVGINPGSYSVYLSKDKQGIQKEGDSYKLSLIAQNTIETYLSEISDDSREGKFIPGKQKKAPTGRPRPRAKAGDTPQEWAAATADLSEQVPHASAMGLDSNDKVLLGLYGVRLAKGAQFEATGGQVVDYLHEAFEMPSTRNQVRHAMDRLAKKPEGLVIKGKTGNIKITSSGCAHIQKLLGLAEPEGFDGQREESGDTDP